MFRNRVTGKKFFAQQNGKISPYLEKFKNDCLTKKEETSDNPLIQQLKTLLPSKIISDLPDNFFSTLELIWKKHSEQIIELASPSNLIPIIQAYSEGKCESKNFLKQLANILFCIKVANVIPKLSFLALLAALLPSQTVAQRYSIFPGVPSGLQNTCPGDAPLTFDCIQGFIVDLAQNATVAIAQFNRVIALDDSNRDLTTYNKLLACFDLSRVGNIVINSLNFAQSEECNFQNTISNEWILNSISTIGNVDCETFNNAFSTSIDSCFNSSPASLNPLDAALTFGLPPAVCLILLLSIVLCYYKNRSQRNIQIALHP